MKLTILLLALLPFATLSAEDFIAKSFHESQEANKPVTGLIVLKVGHKIKYSVDTTNKGNGVLEIGGLKICSYDYHDDGITFQGGRLIHKFIDVDDDGDLDLLVSGIVEYWDEKSNSISGRKNVVAIFIYDHIKKALIERLSCKHLKTY